MTTWIALLPLFLGIFYTFYSSPEKAFLNLYIPLLILLPQLFTAELTIFHNMGFAQNAALPIFLGMILYGTVSHRYKETRISITDFLIVIYVVLCGISEYINSSTEYVLSLLIDKTTSIIIPYFLAKYLIHGRGMSILVSKRIVAMVIIVIFLSVYELRMSVNPFLQLGYYFFPAQGHGWPTIFRFGFTRIAGPFVHTILFGLMVGMTIILNYWLSKSGYWKKYFPFITFIEKKYLIIAILLMGLLFTFSRGPILGALLGLFIATIGSTKKRNRGFVWRFLLLAVAGIIAYEWFYSYSEINRYHAESDWQSTGAYRAELLEKYRKYVLQKPIWGWGFTNLPITQGLVSIDNQYLWLALKHGLLAVGVYVAIISSTFLRLLSRGMEVLSTEKEDYALAFTFAGIFAMWGSSFFTVFMGLQIETVFFISVGWAEGFLMSPPQYSKKQIVYS